VRDYDQKQETSLHAALKHWYTRSSTGVLEEYVDGYRIDIVVDDTLIEIQTRSFAKIKAKLYHLVENHPLRLVYPTPQEKWIVRVDPVSRQVIDRRRSPKKGRIADVFSELVSIPGLVAHPNFTLEVLLIRAEEVLTPAGSTHDGHQSGRRPSWRRKGWQVADRILLEVIQSHVFTHPDDFLSLFPSTLDDPFTARDLARHSSMPLRLAQKMVYCARKMELGQLVEPRRRGWLYCRGTAYQSNNS